jgi:coproporphyrinogen III oxidase
VKTGGRTVVVVVGGCKVVVVDVGRVVVVVGIVVVVVPGDASPAAVKVQTKAPGDGTNVYSFCIEYVKLAR